MGIIKSIVTIIIVITGEREESKMAANVESMFYTRKAPWHGLGVRVEEVLGSKEALIQAGLDWKVEQTDVYAASGERIPGYKPISEILTVAY